MQFRNFGAVLLLYFNIQILLAVPFFWRSDSQIQRNVRFFLYTRTNSIKPIELYVDNENVLESSPYNPAKPTKLATHGWTCNYLTKSTVVLRKALLACNDDNVIIVDWGKQSIGLYMLVAFKAMTIGTYVAKMVDFLERQGSNVNNITLIGHSLGAQVMGIAGQRTTNKVGHVVGLDPAIHWASSKNRIAPESGKFVETIYTQLYYLSETRPQGHANFYPNGGTSNQPGCKTLDLLCSHFAAIYFYAEALLNPNAWLARRCNSYEAFLRNECSKNEIVPFPSWSNNGTAKRGLYFLRTSDTVPYGMGVEGTTGLTVN